MVKKKSLVWLNYSECELNHAVSEWLSGELLDNSILFLEGEMGAGKSSFARALLRVLAPGVDSQGSPSFPLVQTYATSRGANLYHIDLYRLRSALELEDSGIDAQIEEPGSIACIEWASLFPEHFAYWLDSSRLRRKLVFQIRIESGETEATRTYRIELV